MNATLLYYTFFIIVFAITRYFNAKTLQSRSSITSIKDQVHKFVEMKTIRSNYAVD
jgi:hypothetical protein